LTKARDVHNFPLDEAVHQYPVQLHAVATYYDPYIDSRHGALFVCDSSGCVFVAVPLRPILPIQPGDEVEIEGTTGPGDYAPVVLGDRVQREGHPGLPANVAQVSLPRLLTGVLDCAWVRIEGRVRNVRLEPHNAILEIAAEGGSFTATTVREDGADYDGLVDAVVSIQANAAPLFNQNRQMVGVHAFFPTLHELRVVQAAPGDPFLVPAVPIAALFRFSPAAELQHRVHVRGNVTLDWPGRLLCIQDGKDGICAQTLQTTHVALGTGLDVVGFPAISELKPTLEDAVFRASGDFSAPAPHVITPNDALKGNLDGQLVKIDAELIGHDPVASDPTLILRAGTVLFSATLPQSASSAAAKWKEGSLLRITGVSSLQVDALSTSLGEGSVHTQSLHLLLRSAGDVDVLHTPSWWTPQHAWETFAAGGLLGLAALAWIFILRQRVDRQTRALRESEERLRHLSEHDALTGLPNRLLLDDRLQTGIERAKRFETTLGLLMVDLDGFKEVNDAFGHHVGDMVLCELASRMAAAVRTTDTVARMGGDEFIILLPDLHGADEAEMIAAKIVAGSSIPIRVDEAPVGMTVSIGVATYPHDGSDADSLLRCADEAMYAAKQEGKNQLQVYRPKARERSEPVFAKH
jgi:diguanylate cyclase (GGDEF)-like protein